MESVDLTDTLKLTRESEGKETQSYHYSNEYDMINRIVLGATSRKFRVDHEVSEEVPIRDVLSVLQIKAVKHLQKSNTTMIELAMPYEQRKAHLQKVFDQRYSQSLIEEVQRLEA
jgi:hypothetical protein